MKAGRIFDFNRQGLILQMRKLRQLKEPTTKGHWDTTLQPSSKSIFDIPHADNPQSASREMWPSFRTSNFLPHLFVQRNSRPSGFLTRAFRGNLISTCNKLLHYTCILKIASLPALGFLPVSRGPCVKNTLCMVSHVPRRGPLEQARVPDANLEGPAQTCHWGKHTG